jgi:hypothetical protein
MTETVFEFYRGVEIHENRLPSPAGFKTTVQIVYGATVRGQRIKDRSVYRLKLQIDAVLENGTQ